MLMARLDRLEGAREVAQIASVIGNEFSWRLLREVARYRGKQVERGAAEACRQRASVRAGRRSGCELSFQARAHSGCRLPIAGEEPAAAISPSDCSCAAGAVWRSLLRPGRSSRPIITRPGTLKDAAIPYWQRAGERSTRRSANLEAIAHLTRALELLKSSAGEPRALPAGAGAPAGVGHAADRDPGLRLP